MIDCQSFKQQFYRIQFMKYFMFAINRNICFAYFNFQLEDNISGLKSSGILK